MSAPSTAPPLTTASRLQVAAKVLGQRRTLFSDLHIPIPPDALDSSGRLTLRDLIALVVEYEVAQFKARAEARRLTQVLSPEQIEAGAEGGKIELGGKAADEIAADVQPDVAVGTALTAFEDGLYFVFIDEVQHTALEQTVFVGEGTQVMFVRLVALAGG